MRATLYYRSAGSRAFRAKELNVGSDGTVSVEFPKEAMAPPGVEYYLQVTRPDGAAVTDPPVYPEYNPYRIEVGKAGPSLPKASVAASSGSSVPPDQPLSFAVKGPFDRERTRVLLDGADVTASIRIREKEIVYDPPAPLAPGPHRLSLVQTDGPQRAEIPFEVSKEPSGKRKAGVLTARGSLSFNFGENLSSNSGQSTNRTSGNLHVEAEARKGEFFFHFSGVNLQYVKGADPEFTLSSGYLFTAKYGAQTLEIGDVSVNETPLLVSGLSRRGLQLKLKKGGWESHVFDVNSAPVEGFGKILSDPSNAAYGASVIHSFLPDNVLRLHLAALAGKNSGQGGFNAAGLQGPSKGQAVGAKLSGKPYGFTLDAEYALSWYDPNTADNTAESRDDAWQVNASRDIRIGTLSAGYFRFGSRYATVANPNFTGDRTGYTVSYSAAPKPVTLALNGSSTKDNVDRSPDRPVVVSDAGGATIGVSIPKLPSLQLGYTIAAQRATEIPVGAQGVKNVNQNATLGISFAAKTWNVAYNQAFGFLNDRLPTNNDTRTRNYSLSGAYTPGKVSVAPTVSWNEVETHAKTDRSRLGTLSFTIPFWKDRLNLSSQASYQISDASDDSADVRTFNGTVRLAWNIQELLKRMNAGWLNVQIALTGTMSDVDDRKSAGRSTSDRTVLLNFNLGAPYNFEVQRPW